MIDTFFTFLRKLMLMTVTLIFMFAITYVPYSHTHDSYSTVEVAYAGGSFDPIDFPFDIKNAIETTLSTIKTTWIWLKENVLDGVAWRIAKLLISNMTSDIVNWINSGFQGNPAFIQDLDNFLLQAADEAVGEFIRELGGAGSFVCSPFTFQVQMAVALQYDLAREDRAAPTCNLTDIFDNFEDFIDGTQADANLNDWFNIVSRPNITPYGQIITAQTETQARILNAEGEELNLLNFGDGFMSFEMCEPVSGGDGDIDDCFITKPGSIIAGSLNKALGAGQDQLVAADEWDEIVEALVGQLAGTVIKGAAGTLGLSGGRGVTYQGYEGGSFAADLDDGTLDGFDDTTSSVTGGDAANTSGTAASGLQMMRDAFTFQENAFDSVNTYISDLQAFIANPLNDPVDVAEARGALDFARDIRERISDSIVDLAPLISDYEALEAEYAAATDVNLRTQIQNQQADILQDFSLLSLISPQEFFIYTEIWDDILERDVPPPDTEPDPGPECGLESLDDCA